MSPTLEPGESMTVGSFKRPDEWPVTLKVSWEGRGANIMVADGDGVRWTRVRAPLLRRLKMFLTARYEYTYEGRPE